MELSTLDKVKETLAQAAKELDLDLVSVRYYNDEQMGMVLEVLIDKDYQITMDQIQEYTDKVNPLLDEITDLDEAYMLDISSGGSEREIPFEDTAKLLDHYLDIKMAKSGETITAKALSYNEGELTVVYFIKGRRKQLVLHKDDVEKIHMGYKA
ncbi:MAG: hypothetical protein K5762_07520 [Bacilli bacterium]|jgi:ribosome maturation factor RimP|nr:hypothetical protein [Bacilli bacterium]